MQMGISSQCTRRVCSHGSGDRDIQTSQGQVDMGLCNGPMRKYPGAWRVLDVSVLPEIWQALHRGEMVATGDQGRQIPVFVGLLSTLVYMFSLPLGINRT